MKNFLRLRVVFLIKYRKFLLRQTIQIEFTLPPERINLC